jgi:hypothetical protein
MNIVIPLGKCAGAPLALFDALVAASPMLMSKDRLSQVSGYEQSSTFRNALSKLRTLGLIQSASGNLQLSSDLMDHV